MNLYKADLHIHTVLSPCGDLSMSPLNIVEQAATVGLNIIGITDHNSTLHGPVTKKIADKKGIMVVYGAEVTTKEDVHCLCLFESDEQRKNFQEFIENNLPKIQNNSSIFGHQVVVDENEEILEEIESLLITGLNVSIDEVERKVHELDGLFIPAHIDRPKYSLTSQLGFVPKDLKFDALEISRNISLDKANQTFSYIKNARFIRTSDAHNIAQIGSNPSIMKMESLNWNELKLAILDTCGREVVIS